MRRPYRRPVRIVVVDVLLLVVQLSPPRNAPARLHRSHAPRAYDGGFVWPVLSPRGTSGADRDKAVPGCDARGFGVRD
jgi:hypothetical protein